VEPDRPDDIDEMIQEMMESVLIFTPENLPTLVDTSSCLDVTDVLKGSRLQNRASTLLMEANVTSEECGCILSHTYFDIELLRSHDASSESAYAIYLTELQNSNNYEIVNNL